MEISAKFWSTKVEMRLLCCDPNVLCSILAIEYVVTLLSNSSYLLSLLQVLFQETINTSVFFRKVVVEPTKMPQKYFIWKIGS